MRVGVGLHDRRGAVGQPARIRAGVRAAAVPVVAVTCAVAARSTGAARVPRDFHLDFAGVGVVRAHRHIRLSTSDQQLCGDTIAAELAADTAEFVTSAAGLGRDVELHAAPRIAADHVLHRPRRRAALADSDAIDDPALVRPFIGVPVIHAYLRVPVPVPDAERRRQGLHPRPLSLIRWPRPSKNRCSSSTWKVAARNVVRVPAVCLLNTGIVYSSSTGLHRRYRDTAIPAGWVTTRGNYRSSSTIS